MNEGRDGETEMNVMAPPEGSTLGLIAAGGLTPLLVAREARAGGWRVHAFATEESLDLSAEVDLIIPVQLGDAMIIMDHLSRVGIRAIVLSGTLPKARFFQSTLSDPVGLGGAFDWSDHTLFHQAATLLDAQGIRLLDQRQFLGPWLARVGNLTQHRPTSSQETEIARGFSVARQLARLGVGQTVVVKHGVVLAAEAVEGTDETIRRGCRLGGPGTVVVKVAAENHDFRFDVPSIGPTTIEALAEARGAVLAVEASRTLIVEPEVTVGMADSRGLALVARG